MPKDRPSRASKPTSSASGSSSSRGSTTKSLNTDFAARPVTQDEKSAEEVEPSSSINLAKAATKLHHAAVSLRATAKKAKTFEVQKLVKKSKDMRKNDADTEQKSITEELASLKDLDTNFWAGRVLITKMTKARLLPRSNARSEPKDDFPYLHMVLDEPMLGANVLHEPDLAAKATKAYEKAKAKLVSSKLLADQVSKLVEELKKLVGIEAVPSATSVTPAIAETDVKGKAKAIDQTAEGQTREWSGTSETDSDFSIAAQGTDDGDVNSDADQQELERIGAQKLTALGDLDQWNDMLGSDSQDGDGGSGDGQSEAGLTTDEDLSPEMSSSEAETDSDTLSESGDEGSSSDSNMSSERASKAVTKRKRNENTGIASKRSKPAPTGSSTFLPSLSHGFIVGDRSDDDWSDAEADLADRDMSDLKGTKKERKNRMGQRARKAIWEKKYGKNANHLKLLEKEKQPPKERNAKPFVSKNGRVRPAPFEAPKATDAGWGKAVAPAAELQKRQPVRKPISAPPRPQADVHTRAEPSSRKSQPQSTTKKDPEMHPSWIAKQKQKELMAQVRPAGTKIVFD